MPRKPSNKTLKTHNACACGCNEADQYESDFLSHRELKAMGFKKRKFKDTGEPFLFKQTTSESCNYCDPAIFLQLKPSHHAY